MIFAGIDGCRGGWVAAYGQDQGSILWRREEHLQKLLEFLGRDTEVALDMPIGLPSVSGWRTCDRLARERLGPRRSSVFPPPTRELLRKGQFQELKGSGLSIQAFNLFPKIREVDRLIDPELQRRVRETHPELAFARRAGAPLRFSKRSPEGKAERLALLGFTPPTLRGCASDDLIDAAILWLAVRSGLESLPETEELDERGLRMEICC